ncbi:aldo/keto reductase [Candidatus Latescibacterota bacterium]
MMEQRQCGTTGLNLSTLGFGCWAFGGGSYWGEDHDQNSVNNLVRYAVDSGLTYFDTAEAYNEGRSEESLGLALKGIPRDDVVIGTKVLPGNTYPKKLVEHCEASLKRLDLDYVDLYMLHWPITPLAIGAFGDMETALNPPSPDDVYSTLLKLQEQGKIKHIGVSNFGVEFLREVADTGAVVAANQVTYSLLSRGVEFDVLPYSREKGVGLIAYMALLQGILADVWQTIDDIPDKQRRLRLFDSKYCAAGRHGESGADAEITSALKEIRGIVKETGITMADLALKWAIASEGITCVLAGTRSIKNLERNIAAAREPLDPVIKNRLNSITNDVKMKLGPSIDLFESAEHDRSRVRTGDGPASNKAMV